MSDVSVESENRVGTEIKDSNWVYFANKVYGGVSIVEKDSEKDLWAVNNNGEIFEGDFEEILKYCLQVTLNTAALSN